MNSKTCKQLRRLAFGARFIRRLAGTRLPSRAPRYLPLCYYDRYMMVQDLELDAKGNLPMNDDGTPKLKRFDYQVVRPIRVDPDSPRGRYLDLKRAHPGLTLGTYSSTGLSIRVAS